MIEMEVSMLPYKKTSKKLHIHFLVSTAAIALGLFHLPIASAFGQQHEGAVVETAIDTEKAEQMAATLLGKYASFEELVNSSEFKELPSEQKQAVVDSLKRITTSNRHQELDEALNQTGTFSNVTTSTAVVPATNGVLALPSSVQPTHLSVSQPQTPGAGAPPQPLPQSAQGITPITSPANPAAIYMRQPQTPVTAPRQLPQSAPGITPVTSSANPTAIYTVQQQPQQVQQQHTIPTTTQQQQQQTQQTGQTSNTRLQPPAPVAQPTQPPANNQPLSVGAQIAHDKMSGMTKDTLFNYNSNTFAGNYIEALVNALKASEAAKDPAILRDSIAALTEQDKVSKTNQRGHKAYITEIMTIAGDLQDPNKKDQTLKGLEAILPNLNKDQAARIQHEIHTYRVPIVEAHGQEKLKDLQEKLKNSPNPETPASKAKEIYKEVINGGKYKNLASREQIYYGEFYTDMAAKVKELQQTNLAAALQLEKLLQRDFHEAMDKGLTNGKNGNVGGTSYNPGTMYYKVSQIGTYTVDLASMKFDYDYQQNGRNLQVDLNTHYSDQTKQQAHADLQAQLNTRVQESHQAVNEAATHLGTISATLTEHRKNVGTHTQIDAAVKAITDAHGKIKVALDTHAAALEEHQRNGTFMSNEDVQKHVETVKNTIAAIRKENTVIDQHGDVTTKEHAQRMEAQLIPFSININARQLMKETRC